MDKVDVLKQFLVENEGYTDERAELEAEQLLKDGKYLVWDKDKYNKICVTAFERAFDDRGTDAFLNIFGDEYTIYDLIPFIDNKDWFVDKFLSDLSEWFADEDEKEVFDDYGVNTYDEFEQVKIKELKDEYKDAKDPFVVYYIEHYGVDRLLSNIDDGILKIDLISFIEKESDKIVNNADFLTEYYFENGDIRYIKPFINDSYVIKFYE